MVLGEDYVGRGVAQLVVGIGYRELVYVVF